MAPHSPPKNPEKSPIPVFQFSTLDLPRREQFAAWSHSLASILSLAEPRDRPEGFAGMQHVWDLGDLAFARVRTNGFGFTSVTAPIQRQPIDHWLLTLVVKGCFTTVVPPRIFECTAGSAQVHALGRSFDGFVTDADLLLLFVPRDFFRDMPHVIDAAEFSILDHRMGQLFADYMISLARRLPMLDGNDLPRIASATRAMILACAARPLDPIDEMREPFATALLERAKRFIQAHLFDPDLGAAALLTELRVSRSRLYRLFETSGGVTHYIQHRRLLHAYAVLADHSVHRRVCDIAEEHGFSDGAEFSRAFRREFGRSPSEVRASVADRPPNRPYDDLRSTHPSERLGALLRRLQA
jgi:AraC-like DNA-binding protein